MYLALAQASSISSLLVSTVGGVAKGPSYSRENNNVLKMDKNVTVCVNVCFSLSGLSDVRRQFKIKTRSNSAASQQQKFVSPPI